MPQRTERIKSLSSRVRFRVGPFLVHPDRLAMRIDDSEIALEPRTMEVLVALAENAGEVLSPEQLLIDVWGGTFYGDNPVHKAIAHLRRLMEDDSRAPRYIETIRKRGYRLIADVAYPDAYRRATVRSDHWHGVNPYVGLSAFGETHTGVFFGRSRMTAELLTALRKQLDNQRRFVLVVGASGCGKTSLLHAGAIPLLKQEGGFDGLQALSIAQCDLAGCQIDGAHARIATALQTWTLGGRAVFPPGTPEQLASQLREDPQAIDAVVEEAFLRHVERGLGERPHAHLLLTIDHAEAMVSTSASDMEGYDSLQRLLQHLCSCPRVAVVMLTRSDFYPKLIEALPSITELKSSDGHVDVLMPRPGEIAQIIRLPAALTGLTFEEDADSGVRLDDRLRDDALSQPDALPLLQHTLEALYERCSTAGLLDLAAYRDIGGLEGALAHRAEQVFTALPAHAKNRLDAVLARLVSVQPDTDSVSARHVPWSALPDEGARMLAEAFVRARLFVAALDDGQPAFGVTHEALLRQWPRARDWAQDNRRLLQAGAQLRRAAERWVREGRNDDHLLNPGRPLGEALEATKHGTLDIGADERDLLHASQRARQRKRRWRMTAAAMLAILSLASTALAMTAWQARKQAELRRKEAQRLADYMLVELAADLRNSGSLKSLAGVSNEALTYLNHRPIDDLDAAELVTLSSSYRTLGETLLLTSALDTALGSFEHANGMARLAASTDPGSAAALNEIGQTEFYLGDVFRRKKDYDRARKHWAHYLDVSRQLTRRWPEEADWQIELSFAYNVMGTLAQETGHPKLALPYFQRSAALKKQVLAKDPDDDGLRFNHIDSLTWISRMQAESGNLRGGLAGYEDAIRMLRDVLARHPQHHAWRHRLGNYLQASAELSLALGDSRAARSKLEDSLRIHAETSASEPDNREWRRDLAYAQLRAGQVAAIDGARSDAISHFRAAEGLMRSLRLDDASAPGWRRLDASIRFELASTEGGATSAVRRALNDLRTLAADNPDDAPIRAALADALVKRGLSAYSDGRTNAAQDDWQEAVLALEGVTANTTDYRLLAPWNQAHALLGRDAEAAPQTRRLHGYGYRAPDYLRMLTAARMY